MEAQACDSPGWSVDHNWTQYTAENNIVSLGEHIEAQMDNIEWCKWWQQGFEVMEQLKHDEGQFAHT